MAKIKFTKGELKRQRDALKQYQRYLPTLQLKKQQLQLEILQQNNLLLEKASAKDKKKYAARLWAGLLVDLGAEVRKWLVPSSIITGIKNVAGVNLPVFERAEFAEAEYDLFSTPLWLDFAIDALRQIVSLEREAKVLKAGLEILKHELRITTQRVNLFEKVKIPQALEAIRLIKIYIGDQMANAVGRSKAAKRKIELAQLVEVAA
ncbi:MAG: V-type ATP synthase subunit D [Candidatus Omnitrophica bacterium]|nr:V-type ATP synthase subunit D [Candidatus Omnitrophota bacterium]MDD5552443.1 V-type ATP synthase subunit D [Candidatus Omnitrophota bacterium]